MKNNVPYLAFWLVAVAGGCHGGGSSPVDSAKLEVQLLSLQGTVGSTPVAMPKQAQIHGQRDGSAGRFSLLAGDTIVDAAACPLNGAPDPYGGGRFEPGTPEVFDMTPGGSPSTPPLDGGTVGAVAGVDCQDRTLTVCQGSSCAFFTPEQVELQIVDADGWRTVTFAANGEIGHAAMALRYRERR